MPGFAQPLDDVLGSRAKVRLCRLLLHTSEALSAREMGRRTGVGKRSVDLALVDLVHLGVVVREGSSSVSPYRINPKHALVEFGLTPLFGGEVQLVQEMFKVLRRMVVAEAVLGKSGLVWAGIFGSMARGDDHLKSDLDFAVIVDQPQDRSRLHDAISEETTAFATRFGRQLSPQVINRAQFVRMYRDKDSLAMALIKDGRKVAGTVHDLEEVVRG